MNAVIMDAKRVKTVEKSARISGIDAHSVSKDASANGGVDTQGLPIMVYVTPADMHDIQAGFQSTVEESASRSRHAPHQKRPQRDVRVSPWFSPSLI